MPLVTLAAERLFQYRFWINVEQGRVSLTTSVATAGDSTAGNVPRFYRTYTLKNVREGNSFVLADFWRGNKTPLDRSHLKTVKAWKISQFLCTVGCVSPSGFPFFSSMRYFIFTPLSDPSAFETVICVPDRRTDQVFEPCKWDMRSKIYVSLLSNCQSKEILPHVYSTSVSWCKAALCWIGWRVGGGRKRQGVRRRNIRIQTFLSK
jgi:hypothetical protein